MTAPSDDGGAAMPAGAHWLTRDVVCCGPPGSPPDWTWRLHAAPDGLLLDDDGVPRGGVSVPLTPCADGLPAALRERHPHLARFPAFVLTGADAGRAEELLTGDLAIAARGSDGRVRGATGVQIAGVLDDLYRGAVDRALGVVWDGRTPSLHVWAPTARDVGVRLQLVGRRETRVAMTRDADGVWSVTGAPAWRDARYRYEVTVWAPTAHAVVTEVVTDPYAIALTADSRQAIVADLDDPTLCPDGWDTTSPPPPIRAVDQSIYELHVRDFSIGDPTVAPSHRGTYLAFTDHDSDGMTHLRALADAGLTSVELLPTFDFASVPDRRSDQRRPPCNLAAPGPADTAQQDCIARVADVDGFNWGYDPWHWSTPEGSYSTAPDGTRRTLEHRAMVQSLHALGLRVIADVVYNHTFAAGRDRGSVLDRIVPGYYHRRDAQTGEVATSTCCPNTATEHRMMRKLMVDSIVCWARAYRIDGFRFDLMGHHSLADLQAVRDALDALTVADDGVDGSRIHLLGEGWNFGEVADDARFSQARQDRLAGTGIGSFNDRLRDAVHGGGPWAHDPRAQGFGTGLWSEPNGAGLDGDAHAAEQRLRYLQDRIKVGLAGNLRGYRFVDRTGAETTGAALDGTGYAAAPGEAVNYVDAHDNETLFDLTVLKMHPGASTADRARMNTLCQALVTLSQGAAFWHAGTDLLRSKSLDRNSHNSGDWFNRIDWSGQDTTFGAGLPPARDNAARWPVLRPLLERAAELRPTPDDIAGTRARALDLLRLRFSSPLFRLGDADLIQGKVAFPHGGPDQPRGVITMVLDDREAPHVDDRWDVVVVVFNATPWPHTVAPLGVPGLALHPVQARGADDVVRTTIVTDDAVEAPARTATVLVRTRAGRPAS